MKKITTMVIALSCLALVATSCKNKKDKEGVVDTNKSELQQKVEEYAYFDLTTDISKLSENAKQLIPIFFEIGQIMDELVWEQTFGPKSSLDTISDKWMKEFAIINYGAWDRLDNDKPFIPGYGEKPATCNHQFLVRRDESDLDC